MKYKDTDIQWLGKIPEHWKLDRIKDKTINVVGGDWGSDPESELKGENIVVLRVSDLDDIYFSYDDLTIRKIKESSIKNRKINENCLIIEKSGGGEKQLVGRVGYPKGLNVDAISSNFMAKIEFDNSVDLRFVNYMFSGLYEAKLNFPFVQQTTGIQNLNVGYYLTTKVAFPPKKEQIAIANYLDKACERIDKIVKIKEKQVKDIKQYYMSELDALMTCKKNNDGSSFNDFIQRKIPKNWKIDRLRDIAIINDKALSSSTSKDFEFKYIDISNVNNDGIIEMGDIKLMNFEESPSRARRITKKYDTIISSVRTNLQSVAYIDWNDDKKLIVSTGFFVVRPKFPKLLLPKFLYYFLLTTYSKDFFFSRSVGVSYPAINDYKFGSINVFLPEVSEQKKIVDKIDFLKKETIKLEINLKTQIKTLKNYRKSLIHECVTGKRQVVTQTPIS